ncbi:hypothetical protein A3G53_00010 [Candidatus Nomurabacteria bacterium RIFCSPLOWO2_12_FULL_44_11]|uniref:Isoleucine--tRNA ligase n=1 Tax=Candidatus Nomurabacteria bacterium RIFCSPLOWO2_12_FULL_44_11 TaxID=1801796 RepID=A0A1F6Y5B3_9BACT|nr:MAG: hypothetical protein A3G53_00010 [Candidatus Nomurabacteria bacterium RIFCSPLOWO2_12_FULL_44_11]
MSEEIKKSDAALREEKILEFWRANRIFEKSLEQTKKGKEFIFYEGPPTANAKPAIHHLEARAFKDAIPRYKTMQGFHVRRKAGWDTHGLPVELQVEKKLGLNSKKAIEKYGVAKFNQECRKSVWEYVDVWNKFTERMGYWLDQENAYATYNNDYIESVWNVVAEADKQKLLYKDYKVVPWCPRCGTVLSSHELAQGYEDIKDLSITAKFKVKGQENTYFLAWTTTPWTLPGNVALAIGSKIRYVKFKPTDTKETYILAKDFLVKLFPNFNGAELGFLSSSDLVGLEYEPLFPFLKEQLEKKGESTEKAFKVYAADFVNTEDGTGIVHTAVMYGQDDFELGTKVGLPKHHLVDPEGKFIKGTGFLEGRFVREERDGKPTMAIDIIKDLQERNLFFKKEYYTHSYPHCWRCKTALIYYARDSWYIEVSDPKIKKHLISENKKINWEPKYIREGRFGEWLREIKDWAISRERYWGTPLPVWICEKCGERRVIGSIQELEKNAYGQDKTFPKNEKGELDLHRPYIDEMTLKCNCGGEMRRTKEVMDVWLDSGSMPFAQDHYPFSVKEINYPADFICEAIDQTRGWFYTLHAIGILMGKGKAYKNVICLGHLLDATGKKMSKSLGNIVDPWEAMDKYGADTLRLWMYSVNQPGESKNFDEKTVALLNQQIFGLLYNVLAFYELYRDKKIETNEKPNSKNILDQWILARLNELIKLTTENLNNYKLLEPTRALRDFVGDLSTWYLRRSRERIKDGDKEAKQTLYFLLKTLAQVMAPFAPFAAENIWLRLKTKEDEESVHLTEWPHFAKVSRGAAEVLKNMEEVRTIVSLGLEARQRAKIQVRQPLGELKVESLKLSSEYIELIKDELNVKQVVVGNEFKLSTDLSHDLKQEGSYRGLLRAIQDLRKKMNLTPRDIISLVIETNDEGKKLIQKFEQDMKKVVLASKIELKNTDGEEIKIGELVFKIKIAK